jgi:hypothetical protein
MKITLEGSEKLVLKLRKELKTRLNRESITCKIENDNIETPKKENKSFENVIEKIEEKVKRGPKSKK